MNSQNLTSSPSKTNIIGFAVNRTTYQDSTDWIVQRAKGRQSCTVAAADVHSLMCGYLAPKEHGYRLNHFTFVVPDGQPVRWALNLLRKPGETFLPDRVRGPELMLRLCERAAAEGISICLYGSTQSVLKKLQGNLTKKFPNLTIADAISPPFKALSPEEDAEYIQKIRQSGAGIVFVALGCPRQEEWAFTHYQQLDCPIVCVGAAFDMHAGNVREAPMFMQHLGLEWLYRLFQEPMRLWKRYLVMDPLYLMLLALQLMKLLPKKTSDDLMDCQNA
ncbi:MULTISPECIES: WecB/TagA/CpsF family glycosyltransferase [unclassified Coleofasciculus]|uniref:WecB/TagA/CpsF family glycosyltransferase n=1 Tax=unclassified Coleofasciculus TaxID=2692782 RepID=UPI00187F8463|nr:MULTISPECIES: WecB/TagA/CpsF family glycosyltransferase [unclassified Coleofasciculus]MBE9126886.1 WecB/TagA/CpsF family glycosyltransferase [Coleofasciculus sp. LEGE 07081]MBE9150218.1 WecB/TagA/CpsF family glycosyltransferase [Coleofasciculus sp. LEGE 07092]